MTLWVVTIMPSKRWMLTGMDLSEQDGKDICAWCLWHVPLCLSLRKKQD
jgi:hypothetical protein